MHMLVSDGAIVLSDQSADLKVIDEIVEKLIRVTPSPTGRYGWKIPGFRFRYITFAGGSPVWLASVSLLIPVFLLMLIAGICLRDYRRLRKARL